MNSKQNAHSGTPTSAGKRTTEQLKRELEFMLRQNRNFRSPDNAYHFEDTETAAKWPEGRIPNSIFFPESAVFDVSDKPYSCTVDVFDNFCCKLDKSTACPTMSPSESMQSGRFYDRSSSICVMRENDIEEERKKKKSGSLYDNKANRITKPIRTRDDDEDSSTVDLFDRFCARSEEVMTAPRTAPPTTIGNFQPCVTLSRKSTDERENKSDDYKEIPKKRREGNDNDGFETMTDSPLPMPKIVRRKSSSLLRRKRSDDMMPKTRMCEENRRMSDSRFESEISEFFKTKNADKGKEMSNRTSKGNHTNGCEINTDPLVPMPKLVKQRSGSLLGHKNSDDAIQKARKSLKKRSKSDNSFDSEVAQMFILKDDVRKRLERSTEEEPDSYRSFRESASRPSRHESFSGDELRRRISGSDRFSNNHGTQKKSKVGNENGTSKCRGSQRTKTSMGKVFKKLIDRFRN